MEQPHDKSGDKIGRQINLETGNYIENQIIIQEKDDESLNIPLFLPFAKPDPYLFRQIFKKQGSDNHSVFSYTQRENCNLLTEFERHPYIVLLGDAGMGKSTELQWICHSLKESELYLPIYKRLNNYQNEPIYLSDLPYIKSGDEEKFILVLDGLDEPDMQSAIRAIEKFKDDHPKVKILVSCRSNAYADTLPGFEEYYLNKLAYPQIQQYLQNRLGQFSNTFLEYWRDRDPFNPVQLIDNPFYLIRICDFLEGNSNQLPSSLGEVFEFLIEKSLDSRLRIISQFEDQRFRRDCLKSLEKLAFVMECRGENVISKTDLEQLVEDPQERIVLLAKSSLIEFENESWRFAHNNFQEYLAAKVLSRAKKFKSIRRTLGAKPDYKRLKWSWSNTLAFLFSIWEDKNPLKQQLINWLADFDLESLIKIGSFENDNIPLPVRENLFQRTFEACKKEDLIVGYQQYRPRELAEFGESGKTFRYLLNELKLADTPIVRNNALVLLTEMHSSKIPPDIKSDLQETLFSNIYNFESNTSSNRHFAMDALSHLFSDLNNDEVIKIVEQFFDSDDAQERISAYRLIEKQKLQVYFMERLISRMSELKNHHWKKGRVHLLNEDWSIKNCFEDVNDEETLICFFEKYPLFIEDKRDLQPEILNIILEKLAKINFSHRASRQIYESMKLRFAEWFWYHVGVKEDFIITYMERNDLKSMFFKFCIDSERWMSVSKIFLDEKGVEYLISKFLQKEIDHKIMEHYLFDLFVNKNEFFILLLRRLNEVSEEPFEQPLIKAQIKNDRQRKEALLAEKMLYFNKQEYINTIEEIFVLSGKEKFQKDEIYEEKWSNGQEFFDNYAKYPVSLIWTIDDYCSMTKDEMIEELSTIWEWFSIKQIRQFLTNNQEEIKDLLDVNLNSQEIEVIKIWCDKYLPELKLNNEITNGDIVFSWFVLYCNFSDYPESLFLRMIDSNLQNHIDVDIIDSLEKKQILPIQKIKSHVLGIMKDKEIKGRRLYNYLKFIEDRQIKDAIPILQKYIVQKQEGYDCRDYALRIFIALGGEKHYLLKLLKEVVPEPEDHREQILLDHFSRLPDKDFETMLLKKLYNSTDVEQQIKYAIYLFKVGNLGGLRSIIEYIKKEKKSPFEFNRMGDMKFENLKGIPLAFRLFNYGRDSSIDQDDFNRTSSVGRSILQHLATYQEYKHFHTVIDAIRRHLKWHKWLNKLPDFIKKRLYVEHPDSRADLHYLLKNLEMQYYQKENVTMIEAVKTWKMLA